MSDSNGDINAVLSRFASVIVRRRWRALITTGAVSLAVVLISFLLPNRFRSEATIFIAKPRIPEQYVVPNNMANAMEAVEAMKRETFSRARLLQIMDEFGLYPFQRHLGASILTEMMRSNIEVLPLNKDPERRSMNAFLIAFTGDNPLVCQQVTDRLTNLFIEENMQTQQQLDTGTTNFLEEQMEAAKDELEKQEASVRNYKMQNLGGLPEQSAGNMEVLSGLQLQLQSSEASLERARQQRKYLEAMLSQYATSSTTAGGSGASRTEQIRVLQSEIAHLRDLRIELLSRYSAVYPDVVNLDHRIADEEVELNQLAQEPKASGGVARDRVPENAKIVTADPAAFQFRSQLEANAEEIQDTEKRILNTESQIDMVQRRLTLTPVREQQLGNVMRNYESSKQNYANLLNKKTQSELATKLAMQQRSEQFQIIDPAGLPLRPSSPKRPKIALGGLVGGLIAGLVVAFFADARDRSFHAENEVRSYLTVPLVVGIPTLLTLHEERKRLRKLRFEWVMGGLVVLILAAAQVFMQIGS